MNERTAVDTSLANLVSAMTEATRQVAALPRNKITARLMGARVGLTLAGVVSELLYDFMPASKNQVDSFVISAQMAVAATNGLDELLDPDELADYGAGTVVADLQALRQAGEWEIRTSSDIDLERIASAMIGLGAALQDLMQPVANNPLLATDISGAAALTTEAARTIYAHYGGDSGGF